MVLASLLQPLPVIGPMVGGNATEWGQGGERRSMAFLLSARVAAMRRWVPPSFTFSFLRRVSAGMSKLRVAMFRRSYCRDMAFISCDEKSATWSICHVSPGKSAMRAAE